MPDSRVHLIKPLPLILPFDAVYSRLGRNRHLAADPRPEKIDSMIRHGFTLLEPCGAWRICRIAENISGRVVFENGFQLESADASRRLQGCCGAVFMAAAVGGKVVDAAAQAVKEGNGALALALDALGGECADAAMDFVEKRMLQELRPLGMLSAGYRFSAGYGDLPLAAQKIWFELLPLAEWGIELSSCGIMRPEKSVTALIGVKNGI